MIDANELLFVVDEQNRPLKPLPRHIVHKNVFWHRTTGIWVINRKKQILCQKRSMKKDTKPGFWVTFFGGHLYERDTYLENAIKELQEELGIIVQRKNLASYKTLKSDKVTHREFQHIFLYLLDKSLKEIKFEKEETDEIKWLNLNELKKILLVKQDPTWVQKWWDEEVFTFIEEKICSLGSF